MTRRLRTLNAPLPPQPTPAEVSADFEPYRLIQARQLAMLSRADIAAHVGVPAWQVLHWESGISVPKAYQLEKLAEVTDTIVPFFKRGRPMAILDSAHLFMCTTDRCPSLSTTTPKPTERTTMTDQNRDEIAAALRADLNRQAQLVRDAIAHIGPLAGMSPEVAVQEVGRVLRPLIFREDVDRFAVAEVLAEYVVRESIGRSGRS